MKTLGIVSAASALVLWWLSFDPRRWGNGVAGDWVALAVIALVALVLPACVTFVGYWTLKGFLNLPKKLKGASAEVAEHAREAGGPEGTKAGRLLNIFRTIWSVRGLLLDSSGAWGMSIAALRLARLASLPFALGLVVAIALNFVVIALAAVAFIVAVWP